MTWEEFLPTKFGLWVDTKPSTDGTPHDISKTMNKNGILLQIEKKKVEGSYGDLTCHVFSLEDELGYTTVSCPGGSLTIKK